MLILDADKDSFCIGLKKISEFINSKNLELSFEQKKLNDFILLDPLGRQYDKKDVKEFADVRKTMWFKSISSFYLGLIIVTAFIIIFMHIDSIKKLLIIIQNQLFR
jgi:hypothetical protein